MITFEGEFVTTNSCCRVTAVSIHYNENVICSCALWVKLFEPSIFIHFSYYVSDDYNGNFSDNPYFYLYFVCATISSTYTYTWDIKMDWGLFDFKDSEYKYLREEIVYSRPVRYNFMIQQTLNYIYVLMWRRGR